MATPPNSDDGRVKRPHKAGAVPVPIHRDETLSMPIRGTPGTTAPAELENEPRNREVTDAGMLSGVPSRAAGSDAIPARRIGVGAEETFRPGSRLAGIYEVVRLLGVGGMGAVYKGIDHRRGREIAIKTISSGHMGSPNAIARFEREIAAAAAVHHPNIAEIHDSGVSDGLPFIVMEYVRGDDLATVLERERFEIPRAVDLVLSLSAAVQAVHDRNVVHRDLKPENIKVVNQRRGEVAVLLDFGVAKVLGSHPILAAKPTLTAADAIVGSVEYMAPEQTAASPHVDYAADQYAIGVILYRCLTQRLPFEGATALAILRKIADGAFDGPRVHRPDVPVDLERMVVKAMSRYPENRYPSVAALGEALLPYASERGRRLWTDELTSPNRETRTGERKKPGKQASPAAGVAGGTRALPATPVAAMPRTKVLSPSARSPDPVVRKVSEGSKRPHRRAVILVAGMVAIAAGVAVASFVARTRSIAPLVAPTSPLTVVRDPGANVSPATSVAPNPVPADPNVPSGPPEAPQPVEASRGETTEPGAASTTKRPSRRKSSIRTTHPENPPPATLPTETPNHVKLIF